MHKLYFWSYGQLLWGLKDRRKWSKLDKTFSWKQSRIWGPSIKYQYWYWRYIRIFVWDPYREEKLTFHLLRCILNIHTHNNIQFSWNCEKHSEISRHVVRHEICLQQGNGSLLYIENTWPSPSRIHYPWFPTVLALFSFKAHYSVRWAVLKSYAMNEWMRETGREIVSKEVIGRKYEDSMLNETF